MPSNFVIILLNLFSLFCVCKYLYPNDESRFPMRTFVKRTISTPFPTDFPTLSDIKRIMMQLDTLAGLQNIARSMMYLALFFTGHTATADLSGELAPGESPQ